MAVKNGARIRKLKAASSRIRRTARTRLKSLLG